MPRRSARRGAAFPALTALGVAVSIAVGALYVRSERRQIREAVEARLAAEAGGR